MSESDSNPLLAPCTAPHGLPPFASIHPEHFEPAPQEDMRDHRGELALPGTQSARPDFENTVAAFDRAGRRLARVAAVFHNLKSTGCSIALP